MTRKAYNALLRRTGATADFMLHSFRITLTGRLCRTRKEPLATYRGPRPREARIPVCGDVGPERLSAFRRFRVRARPLALEAEWQLDDADVRDAWRRICPEALDAVPPDALYAAMEPVVEALGRWPRARFPLSSAERTETQVAMILRAWSARPCSASNFFLKEACAARLAQLRQRVGTAGGGASEHADDAWSHHAQQALKRLGLAAQPVPAETVFHHVPSKALSRRQQKNMLEKVGVYHALAAGWERTSYGHDMFVARSYLVATTTKAASLDVSDVIRLEDPAGENPWAQLFVFHSTFKEYNETGLRREDPQGHRWCSDKQIFDYTPYVTREDWVRRFLQQRRIERKSNAAETQAKTTWNVTHLWLEKTRWGPLLGDAPVLRDKPMRESDILKAALDSTGLRDDMDKAPYNELLKSDWENKCLFWERAAAQADEFKHGMALWQMWRTTCSSPSALRWLGGTYARHPRDFPAAQQDRDWVHSHLRPLGLQPSEVLLWLRR